MCNCIHWFMFILCFFYSHSESCQLVLTVELTSSKVTKSKRKASITADLLSSNLLLEITVCSDMPEVCVCVRACVCVCVCVRVCVRACVILVWPLLIVCFCCFIL